jgi:DNA-binding response OmpR family regulator
MRIAEDLPLHGVVCSGSYANGRQHGSPKIVRAASQPAGGIALANRDAATPLRVAQMDRDAGLLMVTAKRLERLGYEHRVLPSVVSPKRMAALRLDALVVDLTILGPQCWEWLEGLCELKRSFVIVVCTSSSTVAERVRALRIGADDWLAKPCHPEELIARIEAIVRRGRHAERQHDTKPILAGELEVRRNQCQAFVTAESLNLTRREFQLLELLACHESCVLEREFIYERLWGHSMIRGDRSVDVFVRKVRSKLELVSPGWSYIHTHFGIGYRFAAERLDEIAPQAQRLAA